MRRSEIEELLKNRGIHPNKKLGQNFLLSDGILDRIMRASNISPQDRVLEIGPGLGALTERLLGEAASVTAVEIDAGLARYLGEKFAGRQELTLLHADFLKADIGGAFTKAVSNLPYYASSEILFSLAVKHRVPEVYAMLQREMAERITASPGGKSYGALTAALGLYYEPRVLFTIERRHFYPAPEVTSSFIALWRRDATGLSERETELYHRIIKAAFWGRRKMLATALANSPHISLDRDLICRALLAAGIDGKVRGESLSVEEFKVLVKFISGKVNGAN